MFDNDIRGGSLYRLAVISDADVQVVTSARRRLSDGLHVYAETLNPARLNHDDLVAEVSKLETWLIDVLKRQKDAEPPKVSFAKD